MSTLKTGNITHPSSTGTAITLDASDNVTINGPTNFNSNAVTGIASINGGQIGGANLLVNGDFSVSQRGTSVTPSSGFGYTLDRWRTYSYGSSTTTVSQQSFTVGQTDVPGSPQYFARVVATNTRPYFEQKIENVIPFGGQTVTISLWAKSSDIATLQLDSYSEFGTGGSSAVVDNNGYSLGSLSSTWTKFTHTWTIPSHSGKTIGTNNCYAIALTTVSGDIGTVDIALVQLEFGNTATAFQHEDVGTTLSKCQRYYQVSGIVRGYPMVRYESSGTGKAQTNWRLFPPMRATPSVSFTGTFAASVGYSGTPTTATITPKNIQLLSASNVDPNDNLWIQITGTDEEGIIADAEL